jgi:hypothetical protein
MSASGCSPAAAAGSRSGRWHAQTTPSSPPRSSRCSPQCRWLATSTSTPCLCHCREQGTQMLLILWCVGVVGVWRFCCLRAAAPPFPICAPLAAPPSRPCAYLPGIGGAGRGWRRRQAKCCRFPLQPVCGPAPLLTEEKVDAPWDAGLEPAGAWGGFRTAAGAWRSVAVAGGHAAALVMLVREVSGDTSWDPARGDARLVCQALLRCSPRACVWRCRLPSLRPSWRRAARRSCLPR